MQGLPNHGHKGLELSHRPLQGPQLGPLSVCLLHDTHDFSWVPQFMGLVTDPKQNGTQLSFQVYEDVSRSIPRTTVRELATKVQVCLLKMTLFSLELYQSFIVSYLDSKASKKAFLSIDECQIFIVEGMICTRDILFCHLADITPILVF